MELVYCPRLRNPKHCTVVHAIARFREMPTLARLRSVSDLGAALIGQQSWTGPSVQLENAVVLGQDRLAAASFVENTRRQILEQVKYAFSTLAKAERFHHRPERGGGHQYTISSDSASVADRVRSDRMGPDQ